MVERRGGLRFMHEALFGFFIAAQLRRQNLRAVGRLSLVSQL
jgi:hypothetical protein